MKEWLKNKLKGDTVIWFIIFSLSTISILLVYSATSSLAYRKLRGNTEYYLFKHASIIIINILIIWCVHRMSYKIYAKISKILIWISAILLLFTWFKGAMINSASRWILIPILGNTSFQPSDLAQFSIIIYLATVLSKKPQTYETIKQTFIWCAVICGLIALTNLSTAITLFITCLLIMYIGMVKLRYLFTFLAIGILAGLTSLLLGQRGKTALSRIKAFSQKEIPFQIEQSYIAIAEGGLYGKGPGKSIQRNFLPHPYSDFIYAILIEEYGLLGGIFVIAMYIVFLYRVISTVNKNSTTFGALLAVGLSAIIVLQAIVNLAVNVGIAPVTGITLPFLSMGGTSMIFNGLSTGIILSISRAKKPNNTKVVS
jgi:cell division protein FtsW